MITTKMNQKRGLTDTIHCLAMAIPEKPNKIAENLEQKKYTSLTPVGQERNSGHN